MKRWIFMLGLFLLLTGNCWATAIVQTTDYISFPVVALDSVTGVECVPESVHIHVWRGSLTNTTVYSFRETGDGADLAQIDSVATGYAGAVPQQYYFHDQVQDIDGDGTAGVYTINVRLWRGTTPTSNWFSFQILTQSLNDAITAITVTLDDSLGNAKNKGILTNAEVANIDGWNPITDNDSLIIDRSTTLYITGTPDVNVAQISGDATAADNFETMLDGTGGADLDLGRLRIYAADNETAFVALGSGSGGGVLFKSGATGLYGLETIAVPNGGRGIYAYGQAAGIFGQGSLSGMRLEGVDAFLTIGIDYGILATGGGAGMSAAGSGNGDGFLVARAGTGKDINLNGDGRIHGTIDSATAVALGSADADTLAKIRDYAHAVQESLNAHAPHGDDWGQGGGSLAAITDTVNAILDTLQEGFGSRSAVGDTNTNPFDAGTDGVNVASVDADAIEAGDFKTGAIDADAIAANAIGASEIAANAINATKIATNAIGNLHLQVSTIGASEIAANAIGASELAADAIDASTFADDVQYMVYGGAVWVDTTNGTAGAVVGVNGLPSLPCRGFVNAKTIADAIGITTFCVLGGGDQSIKATMNGYTFMGIGDPTRNKIDLNSQDVGGSMFIDLDITGIQGGDRATYVRCALEDVSIDAAALQCGLRGDITLLGDRDNIFLGCASSVPGDKTPSLIFSGGSESVQFRGYSGGIHLYGMGANDSLSFEAIGGQLQIGAGVSVNAKITARGMITLTDSTAGLNNLTYVATAQYAVDSTMNAIADANKPNFADTANQCDMVMISGDATAATMLKDAFDDDSTSVAHLDLEHLYINGTAMGGVSNAMRIQSDGHAIVITASGGGRKGLSIEGPLGASITGSAGSALALSGAGAGYDLVLSGSGTIAGTIDSCAGPAYAGATLDSIRAHAPHGDDWGQSGAGLSSAEQETLANIRNYAHAVQESINAHAPHGDNWSGAAGSNWSNDQRDSVLNTILDANKANYKATGFATSGDGDSIIAAITDANKANFKASGFATSSEGDSIIAAISDANKPNFKADTASVARSVWDDDVIAQASRTVNASCAGSGLRTVNVYVKNSADSTGLQSYEVSVQDSSSGTDKGRINTDSDGLATFSLDDDTYEISFSAAGWSITSPVYLTVTADDDTTYYATQYSPTPPSATYCTVYSYTYLLTGAYSGCRLEARIPPEYGVVTTSTFLTIPYMVADTSETDGKVELNLIRSTNMSSSTGLTPVKVYLKLFDPDGNAVADTLFEVPDQASKKIW